jgi:hypothetical protein
VEKMAKTENIPKITFDDWKKKYSYIQKLLMDKGFKLKQNRENGEYNDCFYEKIISINVDLGENIKDEVLRHEDLIYYPNEIFDKYDISLSSKHYFTEKKINRYFEVSLYLRLRFNFGYSNVRPDVDFEDMHIWFSLNGMSNSLFPMLKSYGWDIKDYADSDLLKDAINSISAISSEICTIRDNEKENVIKAKRDEIQLWRIEFEKFLLTQKVQQHLIGSLLQFDSLQK